MRPHGSWRLSRALATGHAEQLALFDDDLVHALARNIEVARELRLAACDKFAALQQVSDCYPQPAGSFWIALCHCSPSRRSLCPRVVREDPRRHRRLFDYGDAGAQQRPAPLFDDDLVHALARDVKVLGDA